MAWEMWGGPVERKTGTNVQSAWMLSSISHSDRGSASEGGKALVWGSWVHHPNECWLLIVVDSSVSLSR